MKKRSHIGEASQATPLLYRRIEAFFNRPAVFCGLVAAIIAVKVVCMGLFSSDYQDAYFQPFVREFVDGWKNGFSNPYESYYDRGERMDFPYPPLMLFIMSVGELLRRTASGCGAFVQSVLFKSPLLFMDCLVFWRLCKLYPDKKLSAVVFYFASPIVVYATYMHGQLDVIPTAFLFLSLLELTRAGTKKKTIRSGVYFTLALLTKFHIVAMLPLALIYIYKHRGLSRAVIYFCSVVGATILGVLPFLGEGFVKGVAFNDAQSALFALYLSYGGLKIYAALAAAIFVYLYAMNLNFINGDLLFGLGGLIFSVFLALCAPMPGWYVWVVVFLADFLIRSNGYKHCALCYSALQVLYLVFFIFFHRASDGAVDLYLLGKDCSFLKIDDATLRNIAFTVLSATMLYVIFLMHKFCVIGNSLFNFHDSAFVIGICGDSGVGKTTLQGAINDMLGDSHFLMLEGDGDHKWERGDSNWNNFTHLNPQANYLYRQAMDIRRLKNGETVKRVEYDHKTGRFTEKKTVRPKRFMSISGLHILYLPQLRDIVDLRVYVEADEDLRVYWKTERDSAKRGRTREDIEKQIRDRYDDARKYIYPQKEFADVIIHYFIDDPEKNSVGMKIKVDTKIDMETVVETLRKEGVVLDHAFSEDFKYQIVVYRPSENPELGSVDYERTFSEAFPDGYDILSEPFSASEPADAALKLTVIQAIRSKLRGVL